MLSKINRQNLRILVARPDRVGDVVLSTPIYHTLKQSLKNCYVGALVSPYTAPLLTGNPYIDAVITDDPGRAGVAGDSFMRKRKEIASHKFDAALLLMPTKRHAYMLFLAGIPYRIGVGHILYEVITLTHGVSRHKYVPLRHESDYMLDLARKIVPRKKGEVQDVWTKPEIFLADEEKEGARDFLVKNGFDLTKPVVCIHPGSGHSSPNWEAGRYAELADVISDTGIQVLVTGSESERAFEKAFVSGNGHGARTTFGELSLRELAAVISQTAVFVSASTGPMHIAAAVGTRTVSMFCPLPACSPKLWGPVGSAARIVLPPDDFCRTKCPGDPHLCTFQSGVEGIRVKTVYDEITGFLNESEVQHSKDTSNGYSASNRK